MKIMKIIEIPVIIQKIMKISETHLRKKCNHTNHINPFDNCENHEKVRDTIRITQTMKIVEIN